jgi:hypothetical protein
MSADETIVHEDAAKLESEARDVGWVPQTEFRGDPDRWVDAATYLERGQTYIPFLKANNRKLKEELDSQRATVQQTADELRAVKAALGAVQTEVRNSTAEELTAEDASLTSRIKEAREANDFDREEALRSERDVVRSRLTKAKETPAAPVLQAPAPEFRQFVADNPWFESDPVMQGTALAMMGLLAKQSDFGSMTLAQRYALLSSKMRERFPELLGTTRPTVSKVEGSRGGATGDTTRANGKGYNDLPQTARDTCDRLAERFVGTGKRFADIGAWRKNYAAKYFE